MQQLIYRTGLTMLAVVMLCVPGWSLAAADYAREQRWADEILAGLIVGEPIYLTQKNRHQFLGIYTPVENARMAVVVVHGMGLHPDWGLIGSLRRRLADDGYTTFSIQMPILAADATFEVYPEIFPEAVERIKLAVSYLKQAGYQKIAIVSHSNGSRMSRVYMVSNPRDVSAWIAVSLTQGDTFDGIKVPILDVYGENDLSHVLASTGKRQHSLLNMFSKQIRIPGADHFFDGYEENMVDTVKAFLDSI
jgi:pimeloyl-ACP methyl ester carboxylesterase